MTLRTDTVITVLAIATVMASTGCDRKAAPPSDTPSTSEDRDTKVPVRKVERVPFDPSSVTNGPADEVRSVYAGNVDPVPEAVRYCDAVHALPRQRRAECCGGKPSGVRVGDRCVASLSQALTDGAVEIDTEELARCEEAARAALGGCDWVGNLPPAPPPECTGLVRGTVDDGARCRSSLECQSGSRCIGGGPTDRGICGPPGPAGALCQTAVDPLAAVTLQRSDDHPECRGWCRSNRCQQAAAPNEACQTSAECGPGAHCDGKVCREGFASVGDSCAGGGCQPGARCVKGRCVAPGDGGEPCTSSLECRGGCVASEGGGRTCGKQCSRTIIPSK